MWFADVGLILGWILLGAMLLAGAVAARSATVRARLPRPVAVLAGGGCAAVLFAGQAVVVDRVEDIPGVGPLDITTTGWFLGHRDAAATAAMAMVSTFGGTAGMAVLALIGAVVLWWRHRRASAGVVLVATLGAAALVEGFKHLYGRARPPLADRLVAAAGYSLPSGHALGSVVVLGVLAAAVAVLARRRLVRIAAVAVAVLGTGTIGFSRVYLGVHWATDVLTGWLLGGAWLAVCITALALVGQARPGRHRSRKGAGHRADAADAHR